MTSEDGTQTQPRPNLSTENRAECDPGSTETQSAPNLSTEHQKPGDARQPNDKLDGDQSEPQDDGGRRSSLTDPDAA